MNNIVLIKFGGSLITNKDVAFTAKKEIINALAKEFYAVKENFPEINFILGHGSGSFGHNVAKKYNTRKGVHTPEAWRGFVEVWQAARTLNTIFMETFLENHINCMAFPPSSIIQAKSGEAALFFLPPLLSALSSGVTPVLYGDVVFDEMLGGTIFSTEDIFFYLSQNLPVQKILLAGIESAIFEDFPKRTSPIPKITQDNHTQFASKIGQSASPDVTGGMIEKVRVMMELINKNPSLQIHIFSAEKTGNITKILNQEPIGTKLERE